MKGCRRRWWLTISRSHVVGHPAQCAGLWCRTGFRAPAGSRGCHRGSHLVTALDELDGHLAPANPVPGQLHAAKGAVPQRAYLRHQAGPAEGPARVAGTPHTSAVRALV